jgi:pimeloyl-ACP methyl ester carboxylesterase
VLARFAPTFPALVAGPDRVSDAWRDEANQGQHVYMAVDGVRLHWVEYGRSDEAPPVILLHGLSDSHLTWQRIAPALARNRRVLVLDLPGHGLSDRPDASYELRWYARLVARWLEQASLPKVDIVGHSFGGGVAERLCLECRPRIRRLVLAASGGLGTDIAFELRLASIPLLVEHVGQPFMAIGTRLALWPSQAKLPRGYAAALSAMNARPGSARALARTVRDLIDWRGQRRSFLLRAHEIDPLPPIGVVWGSSDSVVPIAHGRALARAVKGVRFTELKGCGHYLHHDDPEGFLRAVRKTLDAKSWPAMHLRTVAAA